jgi:hypothetical protein
VKFIDRSTATDYLRRDRGLRLTANTLKDRAHRGTGPRFRIINGRALYLHADLDAWVDEQMASGEPRRRVNLDRAATQAAPQ